MDAGDLDAHSSSVMMYDPLMTSPLDPSAIAPPSTIRVLVAGPNGKMGRTMVAGLANIDDIEIVGGVSRADGPIGPASFDGADVIVDFTNAETAPALLLAAIEAGVRPVSGTSGISLEALGRIDAAARARGIAATWCANYRLGGALLFYLTRIVAPFYDSVEIVETHHSTKHDAPSGTALAIARSIRGARERDFDDPAVGHQNIPGTRGGVESGVRIHSVR